MRIPQGPAAPLNTWPPLLATRGAGSASAHHAHHAMHLIIALDGALRVAVEGETIEAAGVWTAPDVTHSIDAHGAEVLLVFVDPESEEGAKLQGGMTGAVRPLCAEERDAILALAEPDALRWGAAAVARLSGVPREGRAVHPRVRRVLRYVQSASPEEDVSLAALAGIAGLSEGRLVHAFRESVGIPLRPYVLWCKLQRAVVAVVSGAPLAQAAAASGFSDAAHMSRTFRRMFGMTPSALRPR